MARASSYKPLVIAATLLATSKSATSQPCSANGPSENWSPDGVTSFTELKAGPVFEYNAPADSYPWTFDYSYDGSNGICGVPQVTGTDGSYTFNIDTSSGEPVLKLGASAQCFNFERDISAGTVPQVGITKSAKFTVRVDADTPRFGLSSSYSSQGMVLGGLNNANSVCVLTRFTSTPGVSSNTCGVTQTSANGSWYLGATGGRGSAGADWNVICQAECFSYEVGPGMPAGYFDHLNEDVPAQSTVDLIQADAGICFQRRVRGYSGSGQCSIVNTDGQLQLVNTHAPVFYAPSSSARCAVSCVRFTANENRCTHNNGGCEQCCSTLGNSKCSCEDEGFSNFIRSDGLTCNERCPEGFANEGDSCVDINECREQDNGGCHSSTVCVNTEGSFQCDCKDPLTVYQRGVNKDQNVGGGLGDECSTGVGVPVTTDVNSNDFHVLINGTEFDDWSAYEVDISRLNPSETTSIFVDRVQVNNDDSQADGRGRVHELTIPNLLPGTAYELLVTPYGGNGPYTELLTAEAVRRVPRTKCSCTELTVASPSDDSNGAPMNVAVRQDRGRMSMQWTDNSLCETGFSFVRCTGAEDCSLDTERSFAADYLFAASPDKACLLEHAPADVYDSVDRSGLELGQTYTYCMRAVDETSKAIIPYASAQACAAPIQVHYESILRGRFELEPTAGRLPVEGVTVTWSLGGAVSSDKQGRASLVTDENGEFELHLFTTAFASPEQMDQLITLSFSKVTGEGTDNEVVHTFLCNEVDECTSVTMMMRHLTLDNELTVQDTTSVLFTGRLGMDGMQLESGNSCPIEGAEVCLREYNPNGDLGPAFVCGNTNDEGIYSLPATLGTLVVPQATFHDHNIIRDLGPGEEPPAFYRIDAGTTYNNIDFIDLQKERLQIEVAGGKCNLLLGEATVSVTHGICEPMQLAMPAWARSFEVPAHKLDVQFLGVAGQPDVLAYLERAETNQVTVDLTDQSEEERAAENGIEEDQDIAEQTAINSDDADTKNPRLARFEYHPQPTVSVQLLQQTGTGDNAVFAPPEGCATALPQRTPAVAQIEVVETYPDGQTCDWVEGDIVITNRLGEDPADFPDVSEQASQLLGACRRPCKKALELDNSPDGTQVVECGGWTLVRSAWNEFEGEDSVGVVSAAMEAQGQIYTSDDANLFHTQVLVECGQTDADTGVSQTLYKRSFTIISPGDADARRSLRASIVDFRDVVLADTREDSTQVDGLTFVSDPQLVPDGSYVDATPHFAQCGVQRGTPTPGVWARMWTRNVQEVHPSEADLPGPACESGGDLTSRTVEPLELPSRAHFDLELMTGELVELEPYTKPFTVVMKAPFHDSVETRVDVVLTGSKVISEEFSVSLPRYEPIVVLRDPPGGLSSASYSNMQSTVAVDVTGVEHFREGYAGFDIGGGAYAATEACIGALTIAFCNELAGVDIEAKGGVQTRIGGHEHSKSSSSGSIDVAWSYSTSGYDAVPGKQSDMFLVPSLNLKFSNTLTVSVDAETCVAGEDTQLKWQFDSPDNLPSFAWLSYQQVQDFEVPRLESLLQDAQQSIAEAQQTLADAGYTEQQYGSEAGARAIMDQEQDDSDAYLAAEAVVEYTRSEWEFQDAVDGWMNTLAAHDYLLDNVDGSVENGLLAKATNLVSPEAIEGGSHTKGGRDVGHKLDLPGLRDENGGIPSAQERADVAETHLITFSGGGAQMTYSYSEGDSKSTDSGRTLDVVINPHAGIDGQTSGPGFKINYEVDAGVNAETHRETSRSDDSSNGAEIGFTLGDVNIGDYFDVEVYTDTRYNTFAFRTTGGASKCPHEEGTFQREQPALSVTRRPVDTLFNPNEPAVFELTVSNNGQEGDASNFLLRTEQQTNQAGLGIDVNGGSLVRPLKYMDLGREGVTAVVQLTRGPDQFSYDDLSFSLISLCEVGFEGDAGSYTSIARETITDIEYMRPCPAVGFSGVLARDRTFYLNGQSSTLQVLATNPSPRQPWRTSPELQTLSLEYRSAGRDVWVEAGSVTPDQLLGAGTHSFSWEAIDLPDGEYQLRLRSQCENAADTFSDYTVTGRVDTRAPEHVIQGEVQNYMPGDEILFAYTEPLLCVEPRVFTAELQIRGYDAPSDTNPEGTVVFNEAQLGLLCEGSQIDIGLPATVDQSRAAGKRATLVLSGVKDLARNTQEFDVEYDFRFATQEPCAALDLSRTPNAYEDDSTYAFVVSGNQASATVQLRNPAGLRWDETQGLDAIVVDARAAGTREWAVVIDANVMATENENGLATVTWTPDASLPEGQYDVRARSVCGEGSSSQRAHTVLRGLVDRTPPAVFAFAPRSRVVGVDEVMTVQFTEALSCSPGLAPVAELRVPATGVVLSNADGHLVLLCEDKTASIIISDWAYALTSLGPVAGMSASLTLTGVQDKAGNTRASPITQHFRFASSAEASQSQGWEAVIDTAGVFPSAASNALVVPQAQVTALARASTQVKICFSGFFSDAACVTSVPGSFPVRSLRLGRGLLHDLGLPCAQSCVQQTWTGPDNLLALLQTEPVSDCTQALSGACPLLDNESTLFLQLPSNTGETDELFSRLTVYINPGEAACADGPAFALPQGASYASTCSLGTSTPHGGKCAVVLPPASSLTVIAAARCTAGVWVPADIEATTCMDEPMSPANGAFTGPCTGLEHGASCDLVCDTGYVLTALVQCVEGVWTAGQCDVEVAPEPRNPGGGGGGDEPNDGPAQTPAPTPAPTPSPTPAPPAASEGTIACGQIVTGSTVGTTSISDGRYPSGDVVLEFIAPANGAGVTFVNVCAQTDFALSMSVLAETAPTAPTQGYCGTTWAETSSPGGATCYPCSTDGDCPSGKACWGSAFCQEGVACGQGVCPGDNPRRIAMIEASECVPLVVDASILQPGATYQLIVEGLADAEGQFVVEMHCSTVAGAAAAAAPAAPADVVGPSAAEVHSVTTSGSDNIAADAAAAAAAAAATGTDAVDTQLWLMAAAGLCGVLATIAAVVVFCFCCRARDKASTMEPASMDELARLVAAETTRQLQVNQQLYAGVKVKVTPARPMPPLPTHRKTVSFVAPASDEESPDDNASKPKTLHRRTLSAVQSTV